MKLLPTLPQAQQWLYSVFQGNRREFEKFLARHRKSGAIAYSLLKYQSLVMISQEHGLIRMVSLWRQPVSILVSIYKEHEDLLLFIIIISVGREARIVGTINEGTNKWFTTIEAGDAASRKAPMYIGHDYNHHYQSLEKIE